MPSGFSVRTWWPVLVVGLLFAVRPVNGGTPASVDPHSLVDPEIPIWVGEPVQLPPPPPPAASSSVRMLVTEHQADLASSAEFIHYAMRVETEAGLQSAGQVAVVYASTYQELHWHYVRIWRDGKMRDVLKPEAIQVLRQEDDAERFTYHGYLTALVLLHDVRVGDVVEYAYTRVGHNPVFDGRFTLTLAAGAGVPVDRLFYRVLAPPDRALHIRTHGGEPLKYRPILSRAGTEHVWTASNLAPIHAVADAPSWDIQIPFIELSEFGSWADVAAWGARLFALPDDNDPQVKQLLATLSRETATPLETANAALRFVQDDVRYLAIEFGESSHRPTAPDVVLQRRFGDCKDKSLLLVALLRQLGFEADVALVATGWRSHVRGLLPSPLAFDHAIVHVVIPRKFRPARSALLPAPSTLLEQPKGPNGLGTITDTSQLGLLSAIATPNVTLPEPPADELWLDATATLQGGSFVSRSRSDFGAALVLRPGTEQLTTVKDLPRDANRVLVQQRYTATDVEKPGRLDVSATYYGATADFYRYVHRYTEPAQSMRQMTGLLARFYPKVHAAGAQEWTDDREKNVVTVHSQFEIPDLWGLDPSGKKRVIEIAPWAVSERLPRPETVDRTAAFALSFPQDVTDDIALELPKPWPLRPEDRTIDDPSFRFECNSTESGATVHATYHWVTTADAVPAGQIGDWTRKMADVRSALGFRLEQNIRLAAEVRRTGIAWVPFFAATLGLLTGGALALFFYSRPVRERNEPPPLPGQSLVGLSGWLILVAIGVTLRPFMLLRELWPDFLLIADHPGWVTRTDPESVSYSPAYAPLVTAELFFGAALITWAGVLLFQFYRKKNTLPFSLAAHLLAIAVWGVVHILWFANSGLKPVHPGQGDWRVFGQAIATVAIWVPYLLVSRRVKRTFVN